MVMKKISLLGFCLLFTSQELTAGCWGFLERRTDELQDNRTVSIPLQPRTLENLRQENETLQTQLAGVNKKIRYWQYGTVVVAGISITACVLTSVLSNSSQCKSSPCPTPLPCPPCQVSPIPPSISTNCTIIQSLPSHTRAPSIPAINSCTDEQNQLVLCRGNNTYLKTQNGLLKEALTLSTTALSACRDTLSNALWLPVACLRRHEWITPRAYKNLTAIFEATGNATNIMSTTIISLVSQTEIPPEAFSLLFDYFLSSDSILFTALNTSFVSSQPSVLGDIGCTLESTPAGNATALFIQCS